ncbi:CBL-interacting protein kinase 4-like [Setaria viridis]|uniref:CBL-interacting protein kinase 4-like n=1 Tax=Setaria viridis TaxID=4556 RepID=UPI003B3B6B94
MTSRMDAMDSKSLLGKYKLGHCWLRHPNVLRLHEVLSRLAALPRQRLPEHAARRVFVQLVVALSYCHACGVAHHDVKPQNVLLDGDGNLKVSDFGLSTFPDLLRDDSRLHTA